MNNLFLFLYLIIEKLGFGCLELGTFRETHLVIIKGLRRNEKLLERQFLASLNLCIKTELQPWQNPKPTDNLVPKTN